MAAVFKDAYNPLAVLFFPEVGRKTVVVVIERMMLQDHLILSRGYKDT